MPTVTEACQILPRRSIAGEQRTASCLSSHEGTAPDPPRDADRPRPEILRERALRGRPRGPVFPADSIHEGPNPRLDGRAFPGTFETWDGQGSVIPPE